MGASSDAAERQGVACPRCGYRCDAGWRYCPSCGWDLSALAGEAGGRSLEAVEHAVMGLVVVKPKLQMSDVLSPKVVKQLRRYDLLNEASGGRQKAFGTAFPFGEAGLFVTGARVLERGDQAELRSPANQTYAAEILGYDLASGVGVLKADVPATAPVRPADGAAGVSDAVWDICFPVTIDEDLVRFLPVSLHHGRVTDVAQAGTDLVSFENLLRSDHTLPSGCRGGLMLDARGAAAGLVLGSPAPGVSYAVPLRDLQSIVQALAQKKKPERPYYGIGLVTPDDRRRSKFSLGRDVSRPLIAYLIPGSPAESAGLRPGDQIVAVGEEKVATIPETGARLLGASPGSDPVKLTVVRGAQEIALSVRPAVRPDRILLAPVDEIQETIEADLVEVTTGPTSEQGLRIADLRPGGRGEDQGYKNGDIIRAVNHKPVRRLASFDDVVRSENSQVFVGGRSAVQSSAAVAEYVIDLDIKTAAGGKDERGYLSMFPAVLAPPVY